LVARKRNYHEVQNIQLSNLCLHSFTHQFGVVVGLAYLLLIYYSIESSKHALANIFHISEKSYT
jgi:hypothetical protein